MKNCESSIFISFLLISTSWGHVLHRRQAKPDFKWWSIFESDGILSGLIGAKSLPAFPSGKPTLLFSNDAVPATPTKKLSLGDVGKIASSLGQNIDRTNRTGEQLLLGDLGLPNNFVSGFRDSFNKLDNKFLKYIPIMEAIIEAEGFAGLVKLISSPSIQKLTGINLIGSKGGAPSGPAPGPAPIGVVTITKPPQPIPTTTTRSTRPPRSTRPTRPTRRPRQTRNSKPTHPPHPHKTTELPNTTRLPVNVGTTTDDFDYGNYRDQPLPVEPNEEESGFKFGVRPRVALHSSSSTVRRRQEQVQSSTRFANSKSDSDKLLNNVLTAMENTTDEEKQMFLDKLEQKLLTENHPAST